jgi:hypothetical protein
VHPEKKQFPVFYLCVTVLQVQSALADRFDLGADEHDPALVRVLYEIIMTRLAVLRGKFDSLVYRHGTSSFL